MTCESSVRGRVGFVRRLLSAKGMTACRLMSRRSPLRSARARWKSLLDRGLASPEVLRRPGALDWPDPLISAGPLLGWRPQDDALAARQILDRGAITPDRTTGSWAGAMGHTQFMPATYRSHDSGGKQDLWSLVPDALASTAVPERVR